MVNNALTITVKKNRGKQFSIEFTEEATRALGSLLQGGGTRLLAENINRPMTEMLPEHVKDIVPEPKGLHKEADGVVEGMD